MGRERSRWDGTLWLCLVVVSCGCLLGERRERGSRRKQRLQIRLDLTKHVVPVHSSSMGFCYMLCQSLRHILCSCLRRLGAVVVIRHTLCAERHLQSFCRVQKRLCLFRIDYPIQTSVSVYANKGKGGKGWWGGNVQEGWTGAEGFVATA